MGKCLAIGLLVLLLQIPLMMIDSLSTEREGRRAEAVSDISKRWGGAQVVTGPVLVVPYCYEQVSVQDGSNGPRQVRRTLRGEAYFLPDELRIKGTLDPESRRRGIYSAVVYSSKLEMTGRFTAPDLRLAGATPSEVLWSEARIMLCLSDVQGLRSAREWDWGGKKLAWQPGTRWQDNKQGLHSEVPGLSGKTEATEFTITLELNGSGCLSGVPLGRHSSVTLKSSWPDPSFTGAWLPEKRRIALDGFEAEWNLSHLARTLPQQWCATSSEGTPRWDEFSNSSVGVSLAHTIDSYRTMDRALKHGILFIALVFTAFFVFEMTSVKGLSALHYALVGGALCLFYLALLALSEFIGFNWAYVVSAGASTLLTTLYSTAILHSGRRALVILGGLLVVYSYLFFVLQMQDYALLAGTLALFAALGAVMWVTRRGLPTLAPAPAEASAS